MSIDPDQKAFLDDYIGRLHRVITTDDVLFAQISATRASWLRTRERGGRVIFIGNGGSAGIASHLTIDLSKNAAIPSLCFNDASLITCLANDYGFEEWLSHAVRLNARAEDCLVAISSSGRSKNIINAVARAREIGLQVITLSGMSADNPLRKLGDINYWADSRSYNIVETAHQFWMMAVIDLIIGRPRISSIGRHFLMSSRAKKVAFFAAKLLLSIGVIVYLVRRLDLQQLRVNLFAVDPWTFLLALVLVSLQTVILNGRWMLIMRSLGVAIEWLAGMRILMISLWFNQVLPSSAGGDVVRIWLLRRRGVEWSQAVKGVMADRFTALLGLIALMVLGLPFLFMRVHNSAAELAIGGLAAGGVAGTIFLLTLDRWPARIIALGPIGGFVRFGTLVRFLLLEFRQRELLFGSAILIHVMTTASCYVLARGLQANLTVLDALIFFPPVILLTAVPISISGWGVREGAMVACLALAGVDPAKSLAVSLLLGVISVIIGVAGGVVWLVSPERGRFTAAHVVALAEDASAPLLDRGLEQTSEMQSSP